MVRQTSSPGGHREQVDRGQLLVFVLMALLFTAGVLMFSVARYGRIVGWEFSPDDFTRREFVYYEIPVLGVQVFPIDRKDCTNDLESHLVHAKLISAKQPAEAERRWDLVTAVRDNKSSKSAIFAEGEARVLCSYLDARDANGKNIWLEWTKKHQDLSKIVWPVIAKLARQELYFFVPDVLVAARGASEAAAFQQRLNRILAERYVELADNQQRLGRHQDAIDLYTEAIEAVPSLEVAYAGRARSLTVLGEQERATADMAHADKISTRR